MASSVSQGGVSLSLSTASSVASAVTVVPPPPIREVPADYIRGGGIDNVVRFDDVLGVPRSLSVSADGDAAAAPAAVVDDSDKSSEYDSSSITESSNEEEEEDEDEDSQKPRKVGTLPDAIHKRDALVC
jgi:hypothetical protein